MKTETKQWVSRAELAEWLDMPVRWFADNAHTGPPYYRLGNGTVRYRMRDVENWLAVHKA